MPLSDELHLDNPYDQPPEEIGVLVGWDSTIVDGQIHLKLEYFPPGERPLRPQVMRLILDHNSASVLGNYLYQITGESGPVRRPKGLMGRLPRD